jgi:hypothetical protein
LQRRLPCLLAALVAAGCIEPTPSEFQDTPLPPPSLGEPRVVELRFLRFDVENVEQALDLADLKALPRSTLEKVWLFDLDVRPLARNALRQLADLPPDAAQALPLPARNLRRLLTTTPDNADLTGTNLEALIAIAASVGIPPARALADLADVAVTDRLITEEIAANVLGEMLIGTHPAATTRAGPVDAAHPDGRYPVPLGSIPLTLADLATDFDELSERFGPVEGHPGAIGGAEGFAVVEADFRMVVKVSLNALPYEGWDGDLGELAKVNSVPMQFDDLFDFNDPAWLRIEGLLEEPSIASLTIKVVEDDAFVEGGSSREPLPTGNAAAWDLPPWTFEAMLAEMALRTASDIPAHCTAYELGTGAVAFEACIDETGWTSLETFAGLGSPPAPAYLWDLLLEIAQVRLHDDGIPEGEADAEVTLTDVPLGLRATEIVEQIRSNVASQPEVLEDLARALTDSTRGDADFFYYQPELDGPVETAGDWLYFVAEEDLRRDASGGTVRPYAYANPGFFADAQLQEKVSTTVEIDGDITHEKVRLQRGVDLYFEDDAGRRFSIEVGDKPGQNRVLLRITSLP